MPIEAIVATLNRNAAWLREAVASATLCSGVRRIWVVDDGAEPPVDSTTFADMQEPGGVEVTLVRRDRGGPSAARNTALVRIDDGAALILDDDDVLLPDGVAAMRALGDRLGAMAVVAAREELHPDGRVTIKHVPPEWADQALPRPGDVFRPLAIFGASGCFITRAGMATGERFDETLMLGEDRDFLRRLARHGPIAVCSKPALRVRLHDARRGDSLSTARSYERRARDHLIAVERWCDAESEPHFREATRWLLGAISKAGAGGDSWRSLTSLCQSRGWPIPFKAKVRWAIRARGIRT